MSADSADPPTPRPLVMSMLTVPIFVCTLPLFLNVISYFIIDKLLFSDIDLFSWILDGESTFSRCGGVWSLSKTFFVLRDFFFIFYFFRFLGFFLVFSVNPKIRNN